MINKRLFELVDLKPLKQLVGVRLLLLAGSIGCWCFIAYALQQYYVTEKLALVPLFFGIICLLGLKFILYKRTDSLVYQSSADLRLRLRERIMQKAFAVGNQPQQLPAATLSQLMVDGIEQLEIYYARFLPQLFYCMFASLLIFITLASFAWLPALLLFICMPFIPIVIMAVMKIAKKILARYWNQYTDLGADFKENLQGLSVLKSFDLDEQKQIVADQKAEQFRKITMKLLSMQLNSITIMDIISYCGAAIGIGTALLQFQQQNLSLMGMMLFILLSAEFFIPMRQLGSLFHVAMNGVSACDKLFDYLDLAELPQTTDDQPQQDIATLQLANLSFAYAEGQPALQAINFNLEKGNFYAFVGKSGSGKSTCAKLLLGQLTPATGSLNWYSAAGQPLSIAAARANALLVDNHAYLFAASIRQNLLMAAPEASEADMWAVLEQVRLDAFVKQTSEKLDFNLSENASNLSGGQRQRLILARALLAKRELYVFDEITSGVDLASEKIILEVLLTLAKQAIIIFVSHRLYNVLEADQIFVFDNGNLVQAGTATELKQSSIFFAEYFKAEQALLKGSEQHATA